MDNPEFVQSVTNLWNSFISADGFAWFFGFCLLAGFIVGVFFTLLGFLLSDICSLVHASFPLIKRSINDRKAKKSGKLTTEQRFELLENKIDSLADIVISTSPEVK